MESIVRIARVVLAYGALCVALWPGVGARAAGQPIDLIVDARSAPRNIVHVHEIVPVSAGAVSLVYPKWIPGWHAPAGPIQNVAALAVSANGSRLRWTRDRIDLYAFHLDVPAGVTALELDFDSLITPDDPTATPNLAIVNWDRVVFYPAGSDASDVIVKPSILLPAGWAFATALGEADRSANEIDFSPVDLATLVDSPLDAGRFFRRVPLSNDPTHRAELDAFADAPADLLFGADLIAKYRAVVAQMDAMYGARHWRSYHFLLTLSDALPGDGIEHHESSDNRAGDDFMTDDDAQTDGADLLPHEFSHSWNGKYRRPADLTTPNFQTPMQTDLLWVYEGMNQYLGDLISFRAKLRDPKQFPDFVADMFGQMEYEPGRLADPLEDTAVSAPFLYSAKSEWESTRRSSGDFYTEGELVWLDVDTIIREQSHGARSLDDFLRAFAGGHDTGPMVVTYTRDDVEALLNAVAPYDWHAFFEDHVYAVADHPPSDELARAGYRLVYSGAANPFIKIADAQGNAIDLRYSLGLVAKDSGYVRDVLEGSPAAAAGLGPGMTIVGVNGRTFSADAMHQALAAAKSGNGQIALLAVYDDQYQTYHVSYRFGDRYPHLVRINGAPDMFARIVAPIAVYRR